MKQTGNQVTPATNINEQLLKLGSDVAKSSII